MLIDKLKGRVPDKVIAEFPVVEDKFKINTPLRIAHFISQCAHESGEFLRTTENLNYSSDALKKLFPKYFTAETALQYHRKPEQIANRIYANRMGNGDEKSGDGWRHRGRGYIQLTGHNNYALFFASIGKPIDVESVATIYPLASAGWFFYTNGLNAIADKGATNDVVTSVTKKINGGTIGLDARIKEFNEYYSLLK